MKQQKPAGKSAAAQPACQQQPFQVRWVRSRDEALRLGTLATVENIAAWNGTSRGAVTVWQEDQPVAVAWIATETFGEGELGLHYRLHDDEVWLFAAVVSPSLRRQPGRLHGKSLPEQDFG
ncbi:MAG: hypothetical protein GXP24_03630, partial [Planctomycetes bacterium]|nr:hypothetical protein [Planctomycetota bacterium]